MNHSFVSELRDKSKKKTFMDVRENQNEIALAIIMVG